MLPITRYGCDDTLGINFSNPVIRRSRNINIAFLIDRYRIRITKRRIERGSAVPIEIGVSRSGNSCDISLGINFSNLMIHAVADKHIAIRIERNI